MEEKNGESIVTLLKKLGCPNVDGLRGEDLDYLWENPASADFLGWACQNLSEDNMLTEEELEKWSQIPKDSVLTGSRLTEAVKHLKASEEDVAEHEDLDAVREELATREGSIDELKRLKTNLANHQARLSLGLSDLEAKIVDEEYNLSYEQKRLYRLNADANKALEKLKEKLKEVSSYNSTGGKAISEADLSNVIREDEAVRAKIRMLVHKRFGRAGEPELDESSLIRGRDVEEFDALVQEIDRIRFSLQGK